MKPRILLLALAALGSSCVSTGTIHFVGDLTAIGVPAKFEYHSDGKNPISGK